MSLYKKLITNSLDNHSVKKVLGSMSQEDQLRSVRSLAAMLHSVYFGTLQALKGEKEFFDIYEVAIESVNDTVGSYYRQLQKKSVDQLLTELEKTGLYEGLELKQKGDKYIFTIKKCSFAGGEGGVHSSIKGIDLPCPIALALGAALSRQQPGKRVYVYPSVYESEGTVTQMDMTTPEDCKKRLGALRKMSRNRK